MSPSQKEQIQEIIEKSKSFALISEEDAREDVLLAKEALKIILEDKGLKVRQFPDLPKNIENKWSSILPEQGDGHFLYSTSILFSKNKINIKEISYSDDDEYVSVNIDSKNKEVTKEDVIFKPHQSSFDAAFYFTSKSGQINEEYLACLLKTVILPKKEDIVIISPNEETISEKIFNISLVAELSTPLENSSIPNLLLASLLIETNNFEEKSNEKTLETASNLLKAGADRQIIDNLLSETSGDSFIRLLGRALARTFTNEQLKSIWTFVSLQDLEKTIKEQPDNFLFYRIIRKITRLIKPQPVFVLLWQTKQGIQVIIRGQNQKNSFKTIIDFLAAKEEKEFLLCGPYKNFSEAEIKIQEALKKVI